MTRICKKLAGPSLAGVWRGGEGGDTSDGAEGIDGERKKNGGLKRIQNQIQYEKVKGPKRYRKGTEKEPKRDRKGTEK